MSESAKELPVIQPTEKADQAFHQNVGKNLADLGHRGVSTIPEVQKKIDVGGIGDVVDFAGATYDELVSGEGLSIGDRVTKSRNPISLALERLKKRGQQKAA